MTKVAAWIVSTSIEVWRTTVRIGRWLHEVGHPGEFIDINERDRRRRLFTDGD